jgi:hypothetical protein
MPAVSGRLLAWCPGSAMPGSCVLLCLVVSQLGLLALRCPAGVYHARLLCLVVSGLGCSLVVCGRLFFLEMLPGSRACTLLHCARQGLQWSLWMDG